MAAEARPRRIGITMFATHGGSGILATELGLNLARRGYEVHFISHAVPVRLRGFDANVYFHEVETSSYPPFPHTPYSLSLASKMAEVVRFHDLELLHVHYAIPHAASSFLARELLRAERRLATVTTLHGTDITLVGREPSFFPLTKFAIEQSDAVTAVSEFLRRETENVFGVSKPIEVIPNFVDTQVFVPRTQPRTDGPLGPADTPLLLHASNFRPVKNIPTVVEVFARVRAQRPCRLVLVGDGPERGPAVEQGRALGVAEDMVFLGNQEDMAGLVGMADVVLLPSESESFGLVALEAMSCATPVVASHRGGLPELLVHGQTGFLHEPTDVAGQAASVLRLLEDPAAAAAMGKRAREVAVERFCISCIIHRYTALYERTLATVGGSG